MSRRGVALLSLAFAAGCRAERARSIDTAAAPSSFPVTRVEIPRATHAVQVGSFSSVGPASATRDSLIAAGWSAFVAAAEVGGAPRWRVLVTPTDDAELAALVAAALTAQGRQAVVSRDAPPDSVAPTGVRVVQANYGTYGMSSTVRWTQPTDRHALLVTVDPVSVEAEPVPNGFVFADELRGKWLQIDRVWDVAPSPDWTSLSYGKAFLVHEREGEPSPQRWTELAQRLDTSIAAQLFPNERGASRRTRLERELQAHKFASSGMAIAYGVGITFVEQVDAMPAPDDGATRVGERSVIGDAVVLEGWRTRWTRSGDTLAVGASPSGSQDFSPPTRWVLVPPRVGGGAVAFGETSDSARFAPVPWTKGTTLDISVPVDLNAPESLLGGAIRSSRGWVRMRRAGDNGERIIGPGRVLAATANGHYVAALAPRPGAASYENPVVVVMYQVR